MKTAKKSCALIIIFSILVCALSSVAANAAYKVSFDVFSDCAYLINTDTGTVIYEKNSDKQTYPASLTKIMTAIITLENVDDLENTMVTAPAYVYNEFAGIGVSTADIRAGETVSMLDLLYALILPSACEAGNIIADYVGGGSIPAFIDMMNAKAKELGADSTHFENPHGLYDPAQVTTARDIAVITAAALKYPIFATICDTKTYQMPVTDFHPDNNWYIEHTNYMMSKSKGGDYYYEFVHGVKTGSIPEVGKNLVSTASKDGMNYMLATLGAPSVDSDGNYWPSGTNKAFEDAKNLYEWAFNNFSIKKIIKEDEVVDEIPVKLGREQDFTTLAAAGDVTALLPNDVDLSAVQKNRYIPESVNAPISADTRLGVMELKLAGEVIGQVDLVVQQSVARNDTLYWLDVGKEFLQKPLVITLLAVLTLLIFLYIIVNLRYKQMKRRRQARLSARR